MQRSPAWETPRHQRRHRRRHSIHRPKEPGAAAASEEGLCNVEHRISYAWVILSDLDWLLAGRIVTGVGLAVALGRTCLLLDVLVAALYLALSLAERLVRARSIQTDGDPSSAHWVPLNADDGSAYVRCWRDRRWRLLPSHLLHTGDVIEVNAGMAAPRGIESIERGAAPGSRFAMDQVVTAGRLFRVVDEQPLVRPFRAGQRDWTHLAFAAGNVVSCRTTALVSALHLGRHLWECSRLSLLRDRLLTTAAASGFEDDEEDEEQLQITARDQLARACALLTPEWLFWNGDLVQNLARASVLAFLDREGTVTDALCRPSEVILPCSEASEMRSVEVLPDIVSPSLLHDPQVHPLSLAAALCTLHDGCAASPSWHRGVEAGGPLPGCMQCCLMPLSRAIYAPTDAFRLVSERVISPTVISRVFAADASLHRFVFGDLKAILLLCSDAWIADAMAVKPLRDSLRWKLLDLYQDFAADTDVLGFAYLPVLSAAAAQGGHEHGSLIFLGGIAMGLEPRASMQDVVDDLAEGGIRFVYFSPFSERISKAFGERLGLETDWNSCILLNGNSSAGSGKRATQGGYSAISDIKARLPKGPAQIRHHLKHVDDIPLHVSIFAECRAEPGLIGQMLDIYAEWGERVLLVASSIASRAFENCELTRQAPCAIGMYPEEVGHRSPAGAHCAFYLPFGSSPYIIHDMIGEARALVAIRQHHLYALYLFGAVHVLSPSAVLPVLFAVALVLLCHVSTASPMRRMPGGLRPACPYALSCVGISGLAAFAFRRAPLVQFVASLPLGPGMPLRTKLAAAAVALAALLQVPLHGLGSLFHSAASLALILPTHYVLHEWHAFYADQRQKRAKLEFNTKLGMHSPV